jgi:hypothetical protein
VVVVISKRQLNLHWLAVAHGLGHSLYQPTPFEVLDHLGVHGLGLLDGFETPHSAELAVICSADDVPSAGWILSDGEVEANLGGAVSHGQSSL